MQKAGTSLRGLSPSCPCEVIDALRDRYSITTAEELVVGVSRSGKKLQSAVGADEAAWNLIVAAAREALPADTLRFLETPAASRFSKGAHPGRTTNLNLRRHLSQ